MPNHVTNRLIIIGTEEQIAAVKEFIKIEKTEENQEVFGLGTIDFNKILPMPKDLHVDAHSGILTAAEYATKEPLDSNPLMSILQRTSREKVESPLKLNDEDWELFIKVLNNRRKYGAFTWYEWANEHWGTKWNAYEQPDKRNTENSIFFQTAWACPHDLMKKLSEVFPDVEFEVAWADEDLGHNLGIIKINNGELIEQNTPEGGSLEAKKLFFEITQDTLEQHDMSENYEYISEV